MYNIDYKPNVTKYIAKIKEKPLRIIIKETIEKIAADPYAGDKKGGDLREIYTRKFTYAFSRRESL
jgi:Txe/YoeB family toxin of Txe-Axe toxin-antitoxin module